MLGAFLKNAFARKKRSLGEKDPNNETDFMTLFKIQSSANFPPTKLSMGVASMLSSSCANKALGMFCWSCLDLLSEISGELSTGVKLTCPCLPLPISLGFDSMSEREKLLLHEREGSVESLNVFSHSGQELKILDLECSVFFVKGNRNFLFHLSLLSFFRVHVVQLLVAFKVPFLIRSSLSVLANERFVWLLSVSFVSGFTAIEDSLISLSPMS